MPPIRKFVFLAALLALAAAAPSQAAPRKLAVGASESASLVPDAVLAKTRMDLAVPLDPESAAAHPNAMLMAPGQRLDVLVQAGQPGQGLLLLRGRQV